MYKLKLLTKIKTFKVTEINGFCENFLVIFISFNDLIKLRVLKFIYK